MKWGCVCLNYVLTSSRPASRVPSREVTSIIKKNKYSGKGIGRLTATPHEPLRNNPGLNNGVISVKISLIIQVVHGTKYGQTLDVAREVLDPSLPKPWFASRWPQVRACVHRQGKGSMEGENVSRVRPRQRTARNVPWA